MQQNLDVNCWSKIGSVKGFVVQICGGMGANGWFSFIIVLPPT